VPRNEEGEFELVLANRQLLSVFFIVVILLGVFFTMGYIVGRSSAPVLTADATPPRRTDTKPLVVDSAAPDPAQAPLTEAPAESTRPITTAPQQPAEPAKSAPKQSPIAKSEPRAEAVPPAKSEPSKSERPKAEPPKGAKGEPASGETYLQLVATAKAEVDVMVDVLKKKGFHAIQSPVPNKDGWMRVLVGPIADGTLNKVRADLESSGFPGDKAIRKTF